MTRATTITVQVFTVTFIISIMEDNWKQFLLPVQSSQFGYSMEVPYGDRVIFERKKRDGG